MKKAIVLLLAACLWVAMLVQIIPLFQLGVGQAQASPSRAEVSGTATGNVFALYLPLTVASAPSHMPTATPTVFLPSPTPTETATYTPSPTSTATPTPTPSPTFTQTPTSTPTPTSTQTPTYTPTSTATPTATPTPITLVIGHITDVHIGFASVYAQRLPLVLQAINQQAQVLVDTGDCTENGTVGETMEYLAILSEYASIPWRTVPGNHDTPWVFQQLVGSRHWSWDIAGYRFIGIDTEQVDYAFLDTALTTEKPCIVFGHFPLEFCNPTDQVQLIQRFRAYHVPIYVAGHTHEDSLRVDYVSGTVFLTGRPGGKGHYRMITIRGFEVQAVDFRSIF